MVKQKSKKQNQFLIPIIVLISLGVFIFAFTYLNSNVQGNETIKIANYFDQNKQLISQTFVKQAIIGDVSGVTYITINVNVRNNDDFPATFVLYSSQPSELSEALSIGSSKIIQPGEKYTWTSDLIDVRQWENEKITFGVTIRGKSDVRRTVDRTSFLTLDIKEDEPLDFSVSIDSSTNNDDSTYETPAQTSDNFETSATGGWDSYVNSWIRTDIDNDGILNEFDYGSTKEIVSENQDCSDFESALSNYFNKIATTPEGYGVYTPKETTNWVIIHDTCVRGEYQSFGS